MKRRSVLPIELLVGTAEGGRAESLPISVLKRLEWVRALLADLPAAASGVLLVWRDPGGGAVCWRSLVAGELTLGRLAENDVRLAVPRISRQHAVLRWTDDRWWLRDLGSTHGTALNGRLISAAVPLVGHVVIELAGFPLLFTDVEEQGP